MGALFSRWRKKPSTVELLEKLEKDIEAIEKQKRNNLEKERRLVGSLLLYSILIYTVATVVFYFYYLPDKWQDRMKYTIPLVSFPLLIWVVKRFLQWYFVKRIAKNELTLEDLRDKKKGILDEVMEKETYKKAKEILERFDPSKKDGVSKESDDGKFVTPARPKAPDGQELRQRNKGATPQPGTKVGEQCTPAPSTLATPAPGVAATPALTSTAARSIQTANTGQQAPQWGGTEGDSKSPSYPKYRRTSNNFGTPMRAPGPPMPRPILPRERAASERVLEYLIGDGPQNRYALICKQCHSHNGMAYKEEFDYLNFRCCYCFTFNKARKQRPNAPRLDTQPAPIPRQLDLNQESESNTDVEAESEDAPAAPEPKKEK